jgi:peptidoglycan hydrolase-like protein with peptidoglycan-binding domain
MNSTAAAAPLDVQLDVKSRDLFLHGLLGFVDEAPELADLGLIALPARANASRPTLREGSSGKDVEKLHKELARLGYSVTDAEAAKGEFGPGTELAVTLFQSGYDLPVTGVADQKTWDVLLKATKGGKISQTVTDVAAFATSLIGGKGEDTSPPPSAPTAPAKSPLPSWFWPVVIVGGVAVTGGAVYLLSGRR